MIMADSDDEYDRKRRDKFRGERSSGDNYRSERRDERRGGASGGVGGREEWPERNNPFRGAAGGRQRPEYREYRGNHRDRYGSPGREMPPPKRIRHDWGDDLRPNARFGPYDPYLMHAWNEHYAAHSLHNAYGAGMQSSHGGGHLAREQPINNDLQTQPAMMTLKQFLDTQDDGISDSEVLRKYSEYKLEFKRQQLNEFFVAHKDEEWFKNKYHPADSLKRKEEQMNFLKRRIEVFVELLENGHIKSVSMDTNQTDPLLRLLDTVVIKLEGGTEDDLKILDERPKEAFLLERSIAEKKSEKDDDVIITSVEKKVVEDKPKCVSPQPLRRARPRDEENSSDDEAVDNKNKAEPKVEEVKKSLKRKRNSSNSTVTSTSDSDSSTSTSCDEDKKYMTKYNLPRIMPQESLRVNKGSEVESISPPRREATTAAQPPDKIILGDSLVNNSSEKSDKSTKEENTGDNRGRVDTTQIAEKITVDDQPETIDLDKVKDGPQPRALHRTSSIFLRNLAPSIKKSEIEKVCQRFDSYLRVAIADPLAERRWYRRGWITFKRDVNIKEICWTLNNTRLKECEMGAIVNRDLSRRVRPVNGMTAHKTIVRADIKLCAKIILNLDVKFKLWKEDTERADVITNNSTTNGTSNRSNNTDSATTTSYGFKTKNPVLQNITDFLIEEASAEEEELLGIAGDNKDNGGEVIERDAQLISVLDCLILYLRIVHSVDFYNHCEYPYEDEMPNRCGIIHARGPPPSKVSHNDIQDYIKNFETKMQTFLAKSTSIDQDELKSLGCKDTDAEVEKFIQANTQELAKDKWLCPLSGKKFKGPEFIRKHILNKHAEKVDEVRQEVEFFNNYLKDPKRPQLPEHPGNTKRHNAESSGGGGGGGAGFRAPIYPPAYAPPYATYAPPLMMSGRGRGFGGSGRRELPIEHQRRIIGYHDLDAPANFDIFD